LKRDQIYLPFQEYQEFFVLPYLGRFKLRKPSETDISEFLGKVFDEKKSRKTRKSFKFPVYAFLGERKDSHKLSPSINL
jgi:hypothetical protein